MTRYGVVLPGGTTLGAYQVPGLERFATEDVRWWVGGSVGSLHTAFGAAGRIAELRPLWREVGQTGTKWFQRLNVSAGFIPTPWQGVYTLEPLRNRLREHRVAGNFRVPAYVGAVHAATETYFEFDLGLMSRQDQEDVLVVSCLQPVVHRPEKLRERYYVDAGVANVIPAIPKSAPAVDEVVVFCPSPIEAEHRRQIVAEKDVSDAFEQGFMAFRRFMGNTVLSDVQERIVEARALGARRISFYAPKTWQDVGKPFVATPESIALRLASGERDLREGPRLVIDL